MAVLLSVIVLLAQYVVKRYMAGLAEESADAGLGSSEESLSAATPSHLDALPFPLDLG